MVPCVRVRVRVPEPHESVQDPHEDHSAHPTVVVARVVVVVSASVAASVAASVVASAVASAVVSLNNIL